MRRLILAFVGLLLTPFAAAQVIGVQPTPIGLYEWNSTQAQFNPLSNSYGLFPAQSTPQPFAFYGWNSSLHQWVPCDTVTNSCPIFGSIVTYPSGTGVVQVSSGTAWGTTLTTQGSGTHVILPSGTPAAGTYIDGGTFAWTRIPFNQTALGYAQFDSLIGAFTDNSGNVIQPVWFGIGPTSYAVPPGATKLQLGVNDRDYSTDTGSWTVTVNGTPVVVPGNTPPWAASDANYPITTTSPGAIVSVSLGSVTTVTVAYVSGLIGDSLVPCSGGSGSYDPNGEAGCVFNGSTPPNVSGGYWTRFPAGPGSGVVGVTMGTLYSAAGTALPTCNAALKGGTARVSDATAPTYMGAYTSGGAITAEVICSFNGASYAWLTD